MIWFIAFIVGFVAFVFLAIWLGSGGETSGKAGDSVGAGSSSGGGGE